MRLLSVRFAFSVILLASVLPACSLAENMAAPEDAAGWGAPRVAPPAAAASQPEEDTPEPTASPVATEEADTPKEVRAGVEPEPTPQAVATPARPVPSAPSRPSAQPEPRQPETRPSEPRQPERRSGTTPDPQVAPTSASAAERSPQITRVSFAERSDGLGYVVRLHASGPIPAYQIDHGTADRLQLTLFKTSIRGEWQRGEPRGPVRQYAMQQTGERTTLTLELEPGVRVESRAYPDRDTNDLLLSLTMRRSAPVAAATGGAPSGGGTADAASGEHWKLDCIVIDPGHGGRDPGATAHGVREKDVTLGVALKLGRYVEDQLGIRVVYTRRDDRFMELAERGRIANESCGKLFVSIHANAAGNHRAHGTETYFLGLHRSESARQVMERENSVVQLESDPNLYSGMDDAALIMQTMAQSTYLRVSEQLAGLIEGQFSERAGRQSRGVKQAGFLVLWRASMPAVLVETGFVTNAEEARFLGSDRGQDLIASAIFRALRDYKLQYERGLSAASR